MDVVEVSPPVAEVPGVTNLEKKLYLYYKIMRAFLLTDTDREKAPLGERGRVGIDLRGAKAEPKTPKASIRRKPKDSEVAFIKKRSVSGELVVVWASSSGGVLFYFWMKKLLQRVDIVASYSGK